MQWLKGGRQKICHDHVHLMLIMRTKFYCTQSNTGKEVCSTNTDTDQQRGVSSVPTLNVPFASINTEKPRWNAFTQHNTGNSDEELWGTENIYYLQTTEYSSTMEEKYKVSQLLLTAKIYPHSLYDIYIKSRLLFIIHLIYSNYSFLGYFFAYESNHSKIWS